MGFLIGFLSGSAVTFIILAIMGSGERSNIPNEQRYEDYFIFTQQELNRIKDSCYQKGIEDGQRIDTLPVSKN